MSTLTERIKQFEGYSEKPTWDYKQWSSGYGTRASGPNDVIDRAEADRRLERELGPATAIVDKHAPGVAPGVRDALISLTYNAGADWTKAGLGEAIRSGDIPRAKELFAQYNKAGGEVLPGLAKRRQAELAWWDAPGDSNSAPGGATVASAPSIAAAPQTAAQPPKTAPQQRGGGMLAGLLADMGGIEREKFADGSQNTTPGSDFVPDLSAPRIAYPQLQRMAPRSRLALARAAARGRA